MKIKEGFEEEYVKYVAQNSNDGYSRAVIDAGEIFGSELDKGETPDRAQEVMFSTEQGSGLTGYMMGALMSAIVHFHSRGDEIRVWWNKQCGGTGEENGTINPAILEIKG